MVQYRDKVYGQLLTILETAKRTDLIFAAQRQNGRRLVAENRPAEAISQLGQSTILHAVEASRVGPMLDDIEKTAGNDKKLQGIAEKFYLQFLNKIGELESKVPKKYSRDMYNRGGKYFTLVDDPEHAKMARSLAAKVVGQDPESEGPPSSQEEE